MEDMDPRFTDTILNKVAVDKGGDSTKAIQEIANIENPQNQKYVLPMMEFDG